MIAFLALLAACSDPVVRRPHPDGGPYKDLVHEYCDKRFDERVKIYLSLAHSLQMGHKTEAHEDGYLAALARDLALAEDFAVLEALERQLPDRSRKYRLWMAVSARDGTPAARKLLGQWANANPNEIRLARSRPGGIEFLLAKLEGDTVKAVSRAHCAHELARAGDRSVIPRMRKLKNDATTVRLRSLRAGSGAPTLGEIVQECIRKLEQRNE